jgi:hypothetical protein
MSANWT